MQGDAGERCKATKQDGSACNGRPWKDGAYCWFHDPTVAADRAAGRRLGGAARSNRRKVRRQVIEGSLEPAEIGGLLGKALSDVLTGKIEPGVANAAANLGRAIVVVRETAELEARIEALEKSIGSWQRRGA